MSIFGIESVDLAGEPRVFPRRHTGDGANYPTEEGFCGVMASLDADAIVAVRFMRLPDSMPSGSPYITLASLADAVSGAAKVKLEWAAVAMGAKPSAGPLNDEGVSTLTWSAGDDHDYKELEWQLDAAAVPAAGDIVAARFTFTAASWTLAAISTWKGWLRYK